MSPVDRIAHFLTLAGIDRAASVTAERAEGTKYEKLIPLTDDERATAFRRSAEQVLAAHDLAEQARDLTISSAKLAISRAIAVGELLLERTEVFAGDFTEWLENYCGERLSRSTAYNYMKAVRYKDALGDDCPEFATLKELYVAAGILPPPSSGETGESRPAAPLFRLKLDVNGPPPEQWEPIQRRDFLQKAQQVVDLYERVKALEDAA